MDDPFAERGSWAGQTLVHPIGLAAVAILSLCMLLLPRRFAVVPMLALACLIPSAQRIVVGGLDFDFLRILVIVGWGRVLVRREFVGIRWWWMDAVFLAWGIVGTLAYIALYGTSSAIVQRLGWAYDGIGMYFLFRVLVRNWRDIDVIAAGLALLSVPVAAAFVLEFVTQRNVFAVFGGVPEFTMVRQGRLRCQGAFSHPILAGCFWASVVPLMVMIGAHRPRLWLSVVGVVASVAIVGMTASSTPAMALLVGIIGLGLYPVRSWMPYLRWSIVACLVVGHFMMEQGIWHLIARVDIVGGSTGWHRFFLIDQAIARFGEWALVGTKSTASWGWGLWDVTNQFVLEGVKGGVATLGFFVLTIYAGFRSVRFVLWVARESRIIQFMAWALGTSLAVHCAAFIGVSYFGQIQVIWLLLLAMLASAREATDLMHRRALDLQHAQRMLVDNQMTRPASAAAP
jgi:hypothetical protein